MDLDTIIGQEIIAVRGLTDTELKDNGWDRCEDQGAAVIELANGVLLYPSCDPEGNSPGFMFGNNVDGRGGCLGAPQSDI